MRHDERAKTRQELREGDNQYSTTSWKWTERELQQECLQVGLHGAVRYVLYAFSEVILEVLEALFP